MWIVFIAGFVSHNNKKEKNVMIWSHAGILLHHA